MAEASLPAKVGGALLVLTVGAVFAMVVARLGFGAGKPSPTIDGPTTVSTVKLAGLPAVFPPFLLCGYADGGYDRMYWTDAFGTNVAFAGDGAALQFNCPGVGTYTVRLTERSNAGFTGYAEQTINCVTR